VQAQVWCTTSRARRVVISLTLLALAAATINWACLFYGFIVFDDIYGIFKMLLTVAVLVINVVVVYQVRRSATNAAANLGVQQHHQSTSSNSVVPTVMLIATSLVYVFFYGVAHIFRILFFGELFDPVLNFSNDTWAIVHKIGYVFYSLASLVFAYNFYIYLITGKRFRSELRKLFSCRISCSSSSPAFAAVVVAEDVDAEVTRRRQAVTSV